VFVLKLRHLLAHFLVHLLFIPLLREIVSDLLCGHLLTASFHRHISCRSSALPLPRMNPSSEKQLGNVVALSHYSSPSPTTITGKSVALLRRSRPEPEPTVVNPVALFLYSRPSPGTTTTTPPLRVLAELGLFLTYRIAHVRVGRHLLVVTVSKPGFRPRLRRMSLLIDRLPCLFVNVLVCRLP
jgi:hypothetical protein